MGYRERIRELAPNNDPRHIEAFMRCEHSTLDALSRIEFYREVRIAIECVKHEGAEHAERLAKSFGL